MEKLFIWIDDYACGLMIIYSESDAELIAKLKSDSDNDSE